MVPDDLTRRVRHLPHEPGVYLWKDAKGAILYVGKAQDLRARVRSYLSGPLEDRIQRMVGQARDVDFVATRNVKEALVLEQSLIKRHVPPYNVMMVDDKKYPYIAVTKEAWPRVIYTRNTDGGATVFGPFPEAGSAKRVARMVNKTFKLRQCRTLPSRECLYYHIGQCTAPCIGAATREGYAQQAHAAQGFLKGEGAQIAKRLKVRMKEAARDLRFEEAAELRDLATSIESVLQRQYAETPGGDDADAVGLAQRDDRACAVVLFIRQGVLVGKEHHFLTNARDASAAEVVGAFLEQYYVDAPHVPAKVLSPTPVADAEALQAAWRTRRGGAVRLQVPERGRARKYVDLAEKNAHLLLEQEFLVRERRGSGGLEALQAVLGLPEPPVRIEAFDVSHHKGEHTVASMVAMRDGKPHKAGYRRFRIRSTGGGDDPGALREAVGRRYRRLLDEEGADALPDLILIDGGRPQLDAAREALAELGLEELPIVGLAKRWEEIHRPHRLHPLRIERASPALHLLQALRDEAHRFAIGYQERLKRKALTASVLDEIPGVGPERRRRLLMAFGSVEGIRNARPEEIAKVPGIPRPLAKRIHEHVTASRASRQG